MTPYDGDEPYIFISYSHNDAPIVFPILEEMNAAGFRIWYDEGIEWGSTWTVELVKHLNKCTIVMVFISGNSVVSPHCQNEILYANSIGRPFFTIYLEDVPLPQHLYGILQSVQYAPFYKYPFKQFLERIGDAFVLAKTKSELSIAQLLERGKKYLEEKNEAKAFTYLKAAADKGNVLAAHLLKSMFQESKGFKYINEAQKRYYQAYKEHLLSDKQKSNDTSKPRAPMPKVPLPEIFKVFETNFDSCN